MMATWTIIAVGTLEAPNFWTAADNDPNYVGNAPGMDHGVLVTGVACGKVDNEKGIAGNGYRTKICPAQSLRGPVAWH